MRGLNPLMEVSLLPIWLYAKSNTRTHTNKSIFPKMMRKKKKIIYTFVCKSLECSENTQTLAFHIYLVGKGAKKQEKEKNMEYMRFYLILGERHKSSVYFISSIFLASFHYT